MWCVDEVECDVDAAEDAVPPTDALVESMDTVDLTSDEELENETRRDGGREDLLLARRWSDEEEPEPEPEPEDETVLLLALFALVLWLVIWSS